MLSFFSEYTGGRNPDIASVVSYGTAFCLLILAATVCTLLVKYCMLDRKGRIRFLSNFKKGDCLFIYFSAIPMFFLGILYERDFKADQIGIAFFKAINLSASLVGFKFEIEDIEKLFTDNPLYRFTVILCFLLVIINTIMFLLSLLWRKYYNRITVSKWKRASDKFLIIGNNVDSIAILKSGSRSKHEMRIICDKLSTDEERKLYTDDVPFMNSDYDSEGNLILVKKTLNEAFSETGRKNLRKKKMKKYHIIINTETDAGNLDLCRFIQKQINNYIGDNPQASSEEKKRIAVDLLHHTIVYVFGNPAYETLYLEAENHSSGVIRYLNKFKQTAVDFVDRFPLTQFMTDKQLDTEKGLLREDVSLNFLLIGFRETNQQIFQASVANNQFLKVEKDKESKDSDGLKYVKYHIFDKEKSENHKNLNHRYYRYRNEFFSDETIEKLRSESLCDNSSAEHFRCPVQYPYDETVLAPSNGKSYLPLPPLPAMEFFHHMDVNDSGFYITLKKILTDGANVFNYVVIAFGTDLENIDLAKKIIEKRNEWEIPNTYIFVRVKSSVRDPELFGEENKCYQIGDEKQNVFNMDRILDLNRNSMSFNRNRVYDSDRNNCESSFKWYVERTQTERDSNFYAVLSLRSKLHMMGLDYVELNDSRKGISEKEYYDIYAKGSDFTYDKNGKPVFSSDYEHNRSSLRHTMAVQEHYRWNAYMISQGIVPSDIEQIRQGTSQSKNYHQRHHGNLTTFEGLLEFYRITQQDVIKYDYQLLDNAYAFISEFGKIVRRD